MPDVYGDPFSWEGAGVKTRSPYKTPIKQYKKQLRADVDRMQAGKLGMTAAEKAAAKRTAEVSAKGQSAALLKELNRQRAAGGSGVGGAEMGVIQSIGEQTAEAGAMASAEIEKVSQQKAEMEAQEIRARQMEERDRKRQSGQFWAQFFLPGAGGMSGISVPQ